MIVSKNRTHAKSTLKKCRICGRFLGKWGGELVDKREAPEGLKINVLSIEELLREMIV